MLVFPEVVSLMHFEPVFDCSKQPHRNRGSSQHSQAPPHTHTLFSFLTHLSASCLIYLRVNLPPWCSYTMHGHPSWAGGSQKEDSPWTTSQQSATDVGAQVESAEWLTQKLRAGLSDMAS